MPSRYANNNQKADCILRYSFPSAYLLGGGRERPPAILSQTGEECIFSVKGIANANPTLISDVLCRHCGVYREELVGNFVLLQMWLSLSVC